MVTNWEGKLCLCNKFNADGGLADGYGGMVAYVQKLVIVFVCTMSLCMYIYIHKYVVLLHIRAYTLPACARFNAACCLVEHTKGKWVNLALV